MGKHVQDLNRKIVIILILSFGTVESAVSLDLLSWKVFAVERGVDEAVHQLGFADEAWSEHTDPDRRFRIFRSGNRGSHLLNYYIS